MNSDHLHSSDLLEVLTNLESLWAVVREDLIWLEADGAERGVILEVNYFDWNQSSVSEGLFEATFWGCRTSAQGNSLRQLGS